MRKKILIVEDEEEFFFLYETMLEDRDYIILHATDGVQAFELLKKKNRISLSWIYYSIKCRVMNSSGS